MYRKFLIASSVFLALQSTGCGLAQFEAQNERSPNNRSKTSAEATKKRSNASFGLNLPDEYQQENYLVTLSLTASDSAEGLVIEQEFPANAKTLQFDDIPVGQYALELNVIDKNSGKNVLKGYGKATIEEGKTTSADIVVSPSANGTGSLIVSIVFDDSGSSTDDCDAIPVPMLENSTKPVFDKLESSECATPLPPWDEDQSDDEQPGCSDCSNELPPVPGDQDVPGTACTSEYLLPVCVATDEGFKIQEFAKDAKTCEWTPAFETLKVVDNSNCPGLPTYGESQEPLIGVVAK